MRSYLKIKIRGLERWLHDVHPEDPNVVPCTHIRWLTTTTPPAPGNPMPSHMCLTHRWLHMQACTPTHTPLKTTLKTKSSPQVFPKLAVTLIHCNPEQWTANHISAALFLSSELLVDDRTSDQQKPLSHGCSFALELSCCLLGRRSQSCSVASTFSLHCVSKAR